MPWCYTEIRPLKLSVLKIFNSNEQLSCAFIRTNFCILSLPGLLFRQIWNNERAYTQSVDIFSTEFQSVNATQVWAPHFLLFCPRIDLALSCKAQTAFVQMTRNFTWCIHTLSPLTSRAPPKTSKHNPIACISDQKLHINTKTDRFQLVSIISHR